jgi:RES domain-containing protein
MLVQDAPLRARYVMIPARFPEKIVERLNPVSLPRDWRDLSARAELQQIGSAWERKRTSAVLAVPSAVVPAESNYLLNPNHPDFDLVAVGARDEWLTDPRLLRRATAKGS